VKVNHAFEDFHVAARRDSHIHRLSTCEIDGDGEFIRFGGLRLSALFVVVAEKQMREGGMVDCSFHLEN
jgi:hypothetical protein